MFKERDRMQKLISDTIITLCNSGLEFDTELSVEGLLGITLDHKDILLVNINEIIKTQQKGPQVDGYSSADDKLVLEASSTPCQSTQAYNYMNHSDGNNETIIQDVDHSTNDMFECHTASEIADGDNDTAVSAQESYEHTCPVSTGTDSNDADYKNQNGEHVIVIKEEPDDYDDCSRDRQPHNDPAAGQQNCTIPMFPKFSQDNFPHLSSTEMSSNNETASHTPAADSVNFDAVSLYTDHLKDEPAELLNQTNSELMNCWFNASSVTNFDVSGSSLTSIPNPQHQLWAPKQATSSGLLHTSTTGQISESASSLLRGRHLARDMTAQLRKHHCPQCSFTSDKLFNVRRHINKKHTGQPSMPMPCTGAGTATGTTAASGTGTRALAGNVTVKAATNTTSLASDIEFVSPSVAACVSVSLYKCLHCPFTSKKKFNVKRHIRQQHDQEVVVCEGCNRRCRNQYYLEWYHKPKCPSVQLSTTT